ncbi:hypothetical protein C8R43DRAFT_1151461 [Mycena crocata]|nr:hypothetical protein C8R43DRAFT_1151461 [Mycena crocata]
MHGNAEVLQLVASNCWGERRNAARGKFLVSVSDSEVVAEYGETQRGIREGTLSIVTSGDWRVMGRMMNGRAAKSEREAVNGVGRARSPSVREEGCGIPWRRQRRPGAISAVSERKVLHPGEGKRSRRRNRTMWQDTDTIYGHKGGESIVGGAVLDCFMWWGSPCENRPEGLRKLKLDGRDKSKKEDEHWMNTEGRKWGTYKGRRWDE